MSFVYRLGYSLGCRWLLKELDNPLCPIKSSQRWNYKSVCVCNGEILSFIEYAWLKSYEVVAIVMAGPRCDKGHCLHDNRHGEVLGRSSGVCAI